MGANIMALNVDTQKNTEVNDGVLIDAQLEIKNMATLRRLTEKLKFIDGIIEVRRT